MDYKLKYFKYKNKYLKLKQNGGSEDTLENIEARIKEDREKALAETIARDEEDRKKALAEKIARDEEDRKKALAETIAREKKRVRLLIEEEETKFIKFKIDIALYENKPECVNIINTFNTILDTEVSFINSKSVTELFINKTSVTKLSSIIKEFLNNVNIKTFLTLKKKSKNDSDKKIVDYFNQLAEIQYERSSRRIIYGDIKKILEDEVLLQYKVLLKKK